MYYGLIALAVCLFGASFKFKDIYEKKEGVSNGIASALRYTVISSIAPFIILICINRFKIEFTLFSFVIALLSAVNMLVFNYCSFKALERANLSLYSIYSMLGGMLLPFLQGMLFYGEPPSFNKMLCVALISVALLLTFEKGTYSKGSIYYLGIFISNGMFGVLTKIFTSAKQPKTSSVGFTLLTVISCIIISYLALRVVFKDRVIASEKVSAFGLFSAAMDGTLNRVANLLLVLALMHVDASVQYPMVTGGVMVVSTIIGCFGEQKPKPRELLSVAVAFAGLLAMINLK